MRQSFQSVCTRYVACRGCVHSQTCAQSIAGLLHLAGASVISGVWALLVSRRAFPLLSRLGLRSHHGEALIVRTAFMASLAQSIPQAVLHAYISIAQLCTCNGSGDSAATAWAAASAGIASLAAAFALVEADVWSIPTLPDPSARGHRSSAYGAPPPRSTMSTTHSSGDRTSPTAKSSSKVTPGAPDASDALDWMETPPVQTAAQSASALASPHAPPAVPVRSPRVTSPALAFCLCALYRATEVLAGAGSLLAVAVAYGAAVFWLLSLIPLAVMCVMWVLVWRVELEDASFRLSLAMSARRRLVRAALLLPLAAAACVVAPGFAWTRGGLYAQLRVPRGVEQRCAAYRALSVAMGVSVAAFAPSTTFAGGSSGATTAAAAAPGAFWTLVAASAAAAVLGYAAHGALGALAAARRRPRVARTLAEQADARVLEAEARRRSSALLYRSTDHAAPSAASSLRDTISPYESRRTVTLSR